MPQKKSYKSPVPVQNNKNQGQGLEKWSDITQVQKWVPQASIYWNTVEKQLSAVKNIVFNWCITSQQFMGINEKNILADLIRCHHEYTQFDQFDSEFSQVKYFQSNLERIREVQLIYKSYNIFRKLKWQVRFDSKFVSKFVQCNLIQMKYIVSIIMMLANGEFYHKVKVTGQFGYARAIETKAFPFNRFFTVKAFRQKNFLVHIGVQKVPVLGRDKSIKRYEFKNYINFVDILGDPIVENPKKLDQRIKFTLQKIIEDVAKRDHSQELQIEVNKNLKKFHYFFYEEINPYNTIRQIFETKFETQSSEPRIFSPIDFKVCYVSSAQTSTLVFNKTIKRWVSQDHLDRVQRKKLNEYQRKVNEEMVKRFVDFQSAKSLVQLLTKIPNFKVKLTNQEKDVIGQNGNVMVIGRSGTGKTTCAVLRLFSIEMLFKIRLSLYKKKFQSEISNTRCSSDDIDQAIGLHCIFLTASPVLTNQIQRYYKKLTDNIKEELQKKRKKVDQERKKQQKQCIKQEDNQQDNSRFEDNQSSAKEEVEEMKEKEDEFQKIEDEDSELPQKLERGKSKEVIEEESEMNQQLKGIELRDDVENEQFNQDEEDFDKAKEEFQQKLKKYHSLQDLTEKDYPGFFTVKSYIMMLDGTLKKPFFIRSKEGNEIVQQGSIKAAWHNERKGVMMIENYYKSEGADNNEQEINERILNQIEEEINYSDEEQLEHEYMRQIQLKANEDKQNLTKKLAAKRKKNLMSFEVDYEFFFTHFWPNVNRKFYSSRNITPQLVWTEIYSTIKGSASSHLFPGQYLPEKVYITSTQNVFLTQNQKLDIYETFCQYERWKIKTGGYDIMDAVNYILNSIRFRGYLGPEIHYLMIDQVQDLPHAIIYLLSKTALHGVFYSGDTAQTIAKGVGFRFCDLKGLFDPINIDYSLNLKKPIVKHLTVNFRSHNNILQLANSIVSSMQILFPKTIDKLAKERSDLDGPKPMILAQNDEEMLFYVLCGDQKAQKSNQDDAMKKPPLDFGCDQVIIVRDQQSKDKIPNMLQHALCLTIYEAKGLQFNDVILFNFFTQCKHPEKWSLLKYLKVIDQEISKEEYDRNLTRHNQQEEKIAKNVQEKDKQKVQQPEEVWVDSQCIIEQADQTIKIKKIVSDVKKIMKDINDYAELCSDLKLLYTAITRPRKTLIIYDQDPACRKIIQKMWENLGIIQIVTKQLIEEESMNQKSNSNTSIFRKVIQSTDKNEWKKQGLKMYARGYFEQAMKCFQRSGNDELYNKAHANLLADRATKMLISVQSQRNSMKQGFMGYSELSSRDMANIKKKLRNNEATSYSIFNEAARIFELLQMFKQAGQCYFSGRKFEEAKESFIKAKMPKQAGQSYEMLKQYDKAARMYDQEGDYLKIIECLDMSNEWEQILKIIKKYQSQMSQVQKSSLLKKYASLALEELVYEIEFENQDQVDKENRPENNRIEVIQEKQSDQEEDDSSEESDSYSEEMEEKDPQVEAEQSYKQKAKPIIESEQPLLNKIENQMLQTVYQPLEAPSKSIDAQSFSDLNQTDKFENQISQEKQNQPDRIDDNMLQTVKDLSFSDLNDSKSPVQIQKHQPHSQPTNQQQSANLKEVQSSFSDLDQSDDFSDLNAKYERQLDPDIESIKSLADPEDPWIRSVISLSQINPKSQYSMVDESQNYNMNVKIIKTKGNIFIQDQIMQKIIRIVSIINSSSTTFLQQFKGYQSLITVNKTEKQQEQKIEAPQIADFEDIDSQTINVILDTLESFKLYKLCLFVCNRYHLPEKAGRYLVSIMMKYSTNCQANTLISSGLLAPSSQRKTELEKGILGSIAVHSILENVNSQFLKIKISTDDKENKKKNTLGTYFVQGLILQGFYKKTIFITNPEQSLHILDNFCDYDLFREVCRNKFLKGQGQGLFLQSQPKGDIERKYCLISLQDLIRKYQIANRLDMISYRYYKQFGFYDKINFIKDLKMPLYLPFMQHIMETDKKLYVFLDKQLPITFKTLVSGDQLQTADTVLGLLCVMNNQILADQLFEDCELKTFLEFYRCIKHIRNVTYHLDGLNSLNILRSILTFYQCKLIENYKSMSFLGSGYCFLNRTSNLANELIEQVKTKPQTFAFFFEQDFNYIMVKISTVMKIIKKKFNTRLAKFLNKRAGMHRFKRDLLPDDYLLHNQELILIDALKEAVNQINSKQTQKTKGPAVRKKKQNNRKPGLNYKNHGSFEHAYIINEYDLSDEDEQVIREIRARNNYVLPIFVREMQYLDEELLSIFNREVKESKEIVMGRQLYCANLNSYYREYVQKIGGFNLYEAIEFKKFKRVDLYADNILSVIDSFPIIDKHVYTAEILVLLLLQYKRLTEKTKSFKIQIHADYLKFFEDLKLIQCIGADSTGLKEFEPLNSDDLHESILIDKKRFRFSYNYAFCGELTPNQLIEVICDYLDILVGQQNSQFVNLASICQIYLLNIIPTPQKTPLYDKLRKSVNSLGQVWNKSNLFYSEMIKTKNHLSFIEAREHVLKTFSNNSQEIIVTCTGNINHIIVQSQRDYEIQTRIINGRKKAVKKIVSWWRVNKVNSKQKLQKGIVNYFDNMLKKQLPSISTPTNELYKSINDFKMLQKLYDCNLTLNVPLILTIEKTREDLLKFYLKHFISSSLDFHYILLTLRKIEVLKQQYTSVCQELQTGILETDISSTIQSLWDGINDLKQSINTWKTDEKWLKERNLAFKKKKVFEVKWMTKSLNQMKIIRKRAGIKKQQKLQLKKKILKN